MPGPGTVRLAGRGFKTARTGANAPQVKLRVQPRGALARKLRDDGRATASVTVRFAPKLSAGSKTKRKRITLKRR